MSAVDELQETNDQLEAAFGYFPRLVPEGQWGEIGRGIGVTWCGAPMAFLNQFFLTCPVNQRPDLETRISRVFDFAEGRPQPWMLVLCREWLSKELLEDVSALVAPKGLALSMELAGMVADDVTPSGRVTPELEFRRVQDRSTRFALADINSESYGIPLELGRCMADEVFWKSPEMFGYVAYLGNRPVAVAGAYPVKGCRYVAFVATVPDQRRKGYAEAVMRHALEECRRATGLTRTTLHATEAGRPVYEKMGYRTAGHFLVFMPSSH